MTEIENADRKVIRVTEQNIHWFEPLLPNEWRDRMKGTEGFFLLGAVEDKTACGVLIFSFGDVIEIHYLMVAEKFRQRGIANDMLTFLCSYMAEGLSPMVCYFAAEDKTDPMYLFFAEREDFTVVELPGGRLQLSRSQVEENVQLEQIQSKQEAVGFFERPNYIQKKFLKELRDTGQFYLEDRQVFEGLIKPLCLTMGSKEQIKAAVFVGQGSTDREIRLSFAWCAPDCGKVLILLFAKLRQELLKELPADGFLTIDAVEPNSYGIVNKLFETTQKTAGYYAAVWDMDAVEKGIYG